MIVSVSWVTKQLQPDLQAVCGISFLVRKIVIYVLWLFTLKEAARNGDFANMCISQAGRFTPYYIYNAPINISIRGKQGGRMVIGVMGRLFFEYIVVFQINCVSPWPRAWRA